MMMHRVLLLLAHLLCLLQTRTFRPTAHHDRTAPSWLPPPPSESPCNYELRVDALRRVRERALGQSTSQRLLSSSSEVQEVWCCAVSTFRSFRRTRSQKTSPGSSKWKQKSSRGPKMKNMRDPTSKSPRSPTIPLSERPWTRKSCSRSAHERGAREVLEMLRWYSRPGALRYLCKWFSRRCRGDSHCSMVDCFPPIRVLVHVG
ncbi:hypothetical protein K466DRAFT_186374 [Polyporus arcularius HHB13444]|uniref:Secreted protein n=1 Tax=Polyporus arcularius HHB13444 TaxID=1314778 RepID=A0A5C3PHU7_9APHY|nr:hypothetical protein K466DRAFT_186374 [Polyporus arcularius HHB13444]